MGNISPRSSLHREVFFIDAALPDLITLTSALGNTEIHFIDPMQDGLEQIALTLQGRTDIDALHIYTHGSAGSLLLGSTTLSGSTINGYAAILSQIGASLSPTGNILLYGCNVGAGDVGQQFVATLSELTGADVAASDDLTGAAAIGGDWALEVESGTVESAPIAIANFEGVLANSAPVIFTPLALSFNAPVDYTVGTTPTSLVSADVNGDSKLDLIVANEGDSKVSVLLCQGEGTFSAKVDYATGTAPQAVAVVDANGDGKLDLAVANKSGKSVSLLLNAGNGTFATKVDYAVAGFATAMVVADVNGDGKKDLVVTNDSDSNTVSVLLGVGDGTFATKVDYATDAAPRAVATADVNSDGKLDVVTANWGQNSISVLLNNGDGTFATKVNYTTGLEPLAITIADVNGDGKSDVVVANSYGDSVSVLLNNGDGTFAAKKDYQVGDKPRSVTVADMNGDNALDLLVTNENDDTLSVLLNSGDGTFTAKRNVSTGDAPRAVITMDVNSDGKLDVVTANSGSNKLSVLLNSSTAVAATSFTEQTPVAVVNDMVLTDRDGNADWNGGSLKVQITANGEETDSLSLPIIDAGNNAIWLEATGNKLMAGTTEIGTASAASVSNNTAWTLTFNTNATNAFVQGVARAVTFNNSSDTPSTLDRTVTFTATDKLAATATLAQTIHVRAVKDVPTLTTFSAPVATTEEDKAVEITLAELFAKGDEAANDGTIDGFIVKSVNNGTLKIGINATLATPFNGWTNNVIDATHNAYWTPAANANGTQNALTVVAKDNAGGESATAIQAQVTVSTVNHAPIINSTLSFTQATSYNDGYYYPYSITTGEVNSDGYTDLVTIYHAYRQYYYDTFNVHLLTNSGNGTFVGSGSFATGSEPYTVVASDFNGDGKTDIVTANYSSNNVSVFLNNGDGTFAGGVNYNVGRAPRTVISVDVNGDNKADLITISELDNTFSVLLNKGNGTFADRVIYAVGDAPRSIASGDVNGDGKADLVVVNANDDSLWVYLNNGNGTFVKGTLYTTSGAPWSVISTDVSGDGLADVVTVNNLSDSLSVFINTGNGIFADRVDYKTGDAPNAITKTDINSDGYVDFVVTNEKDDTITVLLNRGDGTFANNGDYTVGTTPKSITSGDFNGDGKADLAVVNYDSPDVVVLLQKAAITAATAFTEQTAVQLLKDIVISDPDGNSEWSSGSLTVQITANAEATDTLSLAITNPGNNGIWVDTATSKLMAGTLEIGTASAPSVSNNTAWSFTFNANATSALLQNVALALTFNNSSDGPSTLDRTVTVTVLDTHGASASIAQTIKVATLIDVPTLTSFANPVVTTTEDSSIEVTFDTLLTKGNEADVDGTVTAFVVKSVSNGTLKIGSDAATATAWSTASNAVIDTTHFAYWAPIKNGNGTLDAFTLVARDNSGTESLTAVIATIEVTPVNDAPTITAQKISTQVTKTAHQVFSDIAIADVESDAGTNNGSWNGSSLTVQITKNAEATDTLTILTVNPGGSDIWANATGNKLMAGTLEIGTVSAVSVNNNSAWNFTFNANANNTLVQNVARAINVSSSSDAPSTLERGITITVTDSANAKASVFSGVIARADENQTTEITLADLLFADGDKIVTEGFVVKSVDSGTLKIGMNATLATSFNGWTNNVIDATNNAYWTPAANANGTQNALTVVAKDSAGGESATAIQAQVTVSTVNHAPIINSTLSFTQATSYNDGYYYPYSITTGEVNSDGYTDLVTIYHAYRPYYYDTFNVHLLTNNGNGTFVGSSSFATGSEPYTVVAADFNGDGKTDIVTANYSSNNVSVFLNNGDGTFAGAVNYNVGRAPRTVISVDVNGDNKADLVTVSELDNTFSVLLNKGNGAFADRIIYNVGDAPRSIASGDVNGDGKADLVVVNANDDSLWVYLNNGNGTFVKGTLYTTSSAPWSVISTDVSGDGLADVVTVNNLSDSISVFINTGNGIFADRVDYKTGDAPNAITKTDINSDGSIDFVVTNEKDGTITVLLNRGDGTFANNGNYTVGTTPKSVTSGDFNGDGKADLAVVNYDSPDVVVLLQKAATTTATAFTEQTAVQLLKDIVISDPDGNSEWSSGSLTVQITANAEATDTLSLATSNPGNNGIWVDTVTSKLMAGSLEIGTASAPSVSNSTAWSFTFNANATSTVVQNVALALTFNNSSDAPSTLDRTVTFTATDNQAATASLTQTIKVTAVNDPLTFRAFNNPVEVTSEDNTAVITLSELLLKSDATDEDNPITAFAIKGVHSGTLKIGTSVATATPWNSTTNNLIDATHHAWWTPANNSNGALNAFSAVARDSHGVETATAVQATIMVTAVNDAPVMRWQSPHSFAAKADYATSDQPTSVISADFNNDGNADIVLTNYNSNTVSIRLNNGDGTFASSVDSVTGNLPYALNSADLNGDGLADLVVANESSNSLSVLMNGVTAKVDYATGTAPHAVAIADLNSDGKLDVVTANMSGNTVSVLTNKGNGIFNAKIDYATGTTPEALTIADLNGDGKGDIVAVNSASNTLSVLMNKGDGTFNAKVDYATGTAPKAVTSADFNGDGKVDLAVANFGSDTVSLFINKGDGTFILGGVYNSGDGAIALSNTDINGDGYVDLAVANNNGNTVSVLINKGNGTFADKVDYAVGEAPSAITSADVNGDGNADLLVTNRNSDTLSVLLNTTHVATLGDFARKHEVLIAKDIVLADPDGNESWNGGTLQVQITDGVETADCLMLSTTNPGDNGIWLDTATGNRIMAGDLAIGSANAEFTTGNNVWTITFNEHATNELVQQVARALTFISDYDAESVPADMIERGFTITATDNGGNSSYAILHSSQESQFGVHPSDSDAPTLANFLPAEALNGVAANSNLAFVFNEAIQRGSGVIELHSGSETGALIATYDVATSTNITISADTLIINPSNDLLNGTHYFVTFDTGAIKDRAGNSYAGTDVNHFKTEGVGAEYHDVRGGVTFWKNGEAITDVTTTLTSQPTTQLVELRNIQLTANGSRTVELWADASTGNVKSLQLEFVLPTGSKATWVKDADFSSDWLLLGNTEQTGRLIVAGANTTALSAGSVKLGTLSLSATTSPQHAELFLSKGFVGGDTVPTFGIALESMTSGNSANYQHLGVLEGDYTLTGTKAGGTAEHNAVDARDVLAALEMTVGINPNDDGSAISPYQFLAADVTHNGKVNTSDALEILKMAVKFSDAPASEWIFTTDSIESVPMDRSKVDWSHVIPTVALDHDVALGLIGVVKGDIDGSWGMAG